ncbi:hypothetical protein ACLB2K_037802 [Fragaria x ananassa]
MYFYAKPSRLAFMYLYAKSISHANACNYQCNYPKPSRLPFMYFYAKSISHANACNYQCNYPKPSRLDFIYLFVHFQGRFAESFGKFSLEVVPAGLTSDFRVKFEVGHDMLGPDIVQETTEKVSIIRNRIRTTQSKQKSYVDLKMRQVEFDVGDHLFLKVSPTKGVVRFGKKGKLAPRYVGPFEILERVGDLAYRLALPPIMFGVHNVFHVSLLTKYIPDASHMIDYGTIKVNADATFVVEPVRILDRSIKRLRRKEVELVKVCWSHHAEGDASWELESDMRAKKVVGVETNFQKLISFSLSSAPRHTQPLFFTGEEVGCPATVLTATSPNSSVSSSPIQQCRSLTLATGVQGAARLERHCRSDLSPDPNLVTSDDATSLVRFVSSVQSFLGKWVASP